jgi:hypothetical protein
MSLTSLPTQILLLSSLLSSLTSAFPSPQSSVNGSNDGTPEGGIGYDPSALGGDSAGSSGKDTGGVNLSIGATIAIGVVAGFVVLIGSTSPSVRNSNEVDTNTCPVVTAVLFYLSKKRQWELASKVRGSIRRVGTGIAKAMTPRTPHKMTFSPIEKRRKGSEGIDLVKTHKSSSSPPRGRDAEKAGPTKTYNVTVSGGPSPPSSQHSRSQSQSRSASHSRGLSLNTDIEMQSSGRTGAKIKEKKPLPTAVQVPQSRFDHDSPKTPIWNKIFGR